MNGPQTATGTEPKPVPYPITVADIVAHVTLQRVRDAYSGTDAYRASPESLVCLAETLADALDTIDPATRHRLRDVLQAFGVTDRPQVSVSRRSA